MTVRVGVVTYLRAQGLGYDAVALRDAFSRMPEVEASFFPVKDIYRIDRELRKRKLRPDRIRGPWRWPEAVQGTDVMSWLGTLQVVMTLEAFSREIAAAAFEKGVRLVHVPNLEWVSTREGWWKELRAADAVIAKTRHTERALTSLGEARVVYAPWSIPLRAEPPRPTSRPVIFFHSAGKGGEHDPKNPVAVLETFRDVLSGDARARLVFKTTVPGTERKVPIDLEPFHATGNITVVEGERPYEEVLRLTRTADVSVYPSRAEGFGLPLIESLTLGVPVITTDGPPMNEIVAHERNGLLVPATVAGRQRHVPLLEVDREALGDAMARLTDPKEVDRLKAGTREGLEKRRRMFERGLREAIGVR